MQTQTATTLAAEDASRVHSAPEVAGVTRAMFLSHASALPMLRGPTISYAPEADAGGGGGEAPAGDGGGDDDAPEGEGGDAGGQEEGGEGGEGDDDEFEDVEFEGKQYKLPKEVKRGLLREADYTRKTQDHAAAVRAWDAERTQHAERTTAVRVELGRVAAAEDLVKRYEGIPQATWDELRAKDPDTYRELRDEWRESKDKLTDAKGQLTAKEAELAETERTRDATRLAETEATLQRDIQGWGPEMFRELVGFAGTHGISPAELRQASAGEWKILHLANLGAKSLKTKSAVQRHTQAQSTRPAAQTKGSAPTQGVRDDLSTAEWMRRRNAATRKT